MLRYEFGAPVRTLVYLKWNDEGMGSLSGEELNLLDPKFGTDRIPEDVVPLKSLELVESDNGRISESLSTRKTMPAGILTAVNELNL